MYLIYGRFFVFQGDSSMKKLSKIIIVLKIWQTITATISCLKNLFQKLLLQYVKAHHCLYRYVFATPDISCLSSNFFSQPNSKYYENKDCSSSEYPLFFYSYDILSSSMDSFMSGLKILNLVGMFIHLYHQAM